MRTTSSERMKALVLEFGEETVVAPDFRPGVVRHIVLFRYKDGITNEQKQEVVDRFLALAKECVRSGQPYIISIETGSQNSGEGLDQELEQAFVVTFKSEGERNYFVGRKIVKKNGNFDPAHDAFKHFVTPLLHEPVDPSGVLVFDFQLYRKVP